MVTLITRTKTGFKREDSDKYGKPFDVSKIEIKDYEKMIKGNLMILNAFEELLVAADLAPQLKDELMDERWEVLEEQHGNGWLSLMKFQIATLILKKTNLIWWNLSLHPLVQRMIIRTLSEVKDGKYVLWTYESFNLYDPTVIIDLDEEDEKNA